MRNFTKTILVSVSILFTGAIYGQCPTVTCPADIYVSADSTCNAVVNYTIPQGIDLCDLDSVIFNYSGTINNWVVPAGVTSVTIEARGAQGSNNTSSGIPAGLGAIMIGDFTVTPGQTLQILVGQQYHSTGGNGGGGGTFVVDMTNNPLIVAGGGGGSAQSLDSPNKHGQVGTTGGLGSGGGGAGGTNGNGGYAGAAFSSGAGAGLLTDGADGWTANSGGDAFVNGGAGANVGFGIGGFGGGGNGSGYIVGGGGGGYSGGGAGSNSVGSGGVGGGGASFNGGTNQNNTGGVNTGHGMVKITYGGATTTTFVSGIGNGGTFPVGTTTETYAVVNVFGDSAYCSFNVTVTDSVAPTITAPQNITQCNPVVTGIAATTWDNCGGETVSYNMTGATTGSGNGDVSGTSFNVGTTTIWYIVTDQSGNMDSSSFNVTINPAPAVTLNAFTDSTICVYDDPVALPLGTPANGTYSGTGVSGGNFDPNLSGVGTFWVTYSYIDTATECIGMDSTAIIVESCANINDYGSIEGLSIYPNPGDGLFTVEFNNNSLEAYRLRVLDVNGKEINVIQTSDQHVSIIVDITSHPDGFYYLEIESETSNANYKLIKH